MADEEPREAVLRILEELADVYRPHETNSDIPPEAIRLLAQMGITAEGTIDQWLMEAGIGECKLFLGGVPELVASGSASRIKGHTWVASQRTASTLGGW